jgi:glucose 1-dehydrogenase
MADDAARRLAGRAALVTGASSGIGRSCAIALARSGAKVAVNHLPRSRAAAEGVVAQIEAAGGGALAVAADVSDEAQVEAMFARAVEAFGGLDVVVCHAGVQDDARFVDMTVAPDEQRA